MFKAALAINYVRWTGILGVTAGIHAAAFCIFVGGGGSGEGHTVPEGRVTLRLTQAEEFASPSLTPLRTIEQPVVPRNRPVQIERTLTAPGRLPAVPPQTPAPVAPTSRRSLPQTTSPVARAVAPNTRYQRTAGASTSELDRPLCLGDGQVPPPVVPGPERRDGACDSRHAANGRPDVSATPGNANAGEGVEADFALNGKPVYPIECRRGDCTRYRPCEGISRWRITVAAPNGTPSRIERIQSAGCARLDASVECFLREAHIPRAGTFLLRFRFNLDGR